jgi:hypothetical protein
MPAPGDRAASQASNHYTLNRWRRFSRLALSTLRPPLVFIRARNPCRRLRRRTLGCHVRFGISLHLISWSNIRSKSQQGGWQFLNGLLI